jgi:hypothetical protein
MLPLLRLLGLAFHSTVVEGVEREQNGSSLDCVQHLDMDILATAWVTRLIHAQLPLWSGKRKNPMLLSPTAATSPSL